MGLVYLGEVNGKRGVSYSSRHIDADGQSFIFNTDEAGSFDLKFYRQDFVRDFILNDYVKVIVSDSPEPSAAGYYSRDPNGERVVAGPRWPSAELERAAFIGSKQAPAAQVPVVPPTPNQAKKAVETSAKAEAGAKAEPAQTPKPTATREKAPQAEKQPPQTVPAPPVTVPQAAPPTPPLAQKPAQAPDEAAPESAAPASAAASRESQSAALPATEDGLLALAKKSIDEKSYPEALRALEQIRELFPFGSDELYWLLGQLYEANGPQRDIRSSLSYYRRLLNEYPQSPRFDSARKRIAYLERFYVNIQ